MIILLQLYTPLYPVLVFPTTRKCEDDTKPVLHFSTVRSLKNTTIDHYELIDFLLQEMELRVEGKFFVLKTFTKKRGHGQQDFWILFICNVRKG